MRLFAQQRFTVLLTCVVVLGAGAVCGGFGEVKKNTATTFTDSRDGKKYRAVKIGNATWMAQNLNYQTGKSWCYNNNKSNCEKYGRLYDWNTAKTVCPAGYHLPSRGEWDALEMAATDRTLRALKSASGWKGDGDGTDEYGFSALPGGVRDQVGSFYYVGYGGFWWAATEDESGEAYWQRMSYDGDDLNEVNNDRKNGFSVRCVGN